MTNARGFGVAGALDHGIAAELAFAAQQAGYSTFWANDTPGGDGMASLAAAAAVTSNIQLGVGVIPVDRRPSEAIAQRIAELGLPQDRLIVGIGSGALTAGALDAVREAALQLRGLLSARIVVGSLGPRMSELGGGVADGVLLNWLSPSYLPVVARIARDAAAVSGRPDPWIGAYVRVALAGPALDRLNAESTRYAGYPQYAAHFERMGARALDTCVAGSAGTIGTRLDAFLDADEIVVRAIAAHETYDSYLDLLRAAAPKESAR